MKMDKAACWQTQTPLASLEALELMRSLASNAAKYPPGSGQRFMLLL